MSSQLLFGDHFTILETSGKWIRVMTAYDEYEGWLDHKQFTEIDQAAFVSMHDLNTVLGLSISHRVIKTAVNESLNLIAGTNLPPVENNYFYIGDTEYRLEGTAVKPDRDNFNRDIADAAMFYLNTPYLWGGRSPFGIDCSGYCQMVFRQFGIRLKRDAWQQAGQGELLDFLQEAKAGDLAFFDNEEGRIIHVGIMLDSSRVIHASGRVKIEAIDNQGIYSTELNGYTHKLRIIKRFV